MHDMSNTRKEIAARLGFAAGNGAKAEFGNVDRLESLMAACYRALKNNDKAAAKRLIEDASKEIDSSIPAYIVSEYRDLRRSMHNARPGVKSVFGNADRLDSLMAAVYRALKNNDKASAKRLMADAAKEIAENTPSYILAEYKDLKKGMSRPGAKAKFEATGSKKYFLGELDTIIAGISEMNRLLEKQARGNPKIKEVLTALNKAESVLVAAESKLMQIDFSRSGAKVKFNWKESTTKINDDLNVALQAINANDLDKAIRYIKQAQTRAFYIFSRPGAKTRMTREQTEEQKAGLKIMSAADPAVGAKIATLIKEGKPQDQAVAIALDMKRRGEI